MYCRKCGTEIPDDSAFCMKCGTPVAGTLEQKTTTKPAEQFREITESKNETPTKEQIEWAQSEASSVSNQRVPAKGINKGLITFAVLAVVALLSVGVYFIYFGADFFSFGGIGKKTVDLNELVLLNNADCKITALSYDAELRELKLRLENKKSEKVLVQTRGTTANNSAVTAYFSCEIAANDIAYDEIRYSENDFKRFNIQNVEKLGMEFYIDYRWANPSNSTRYTTEYISFNIQK